MFHLELYLQTIKKINCLSIEQVHYAVVYYFYKHLEPGISHPPLYLATGINSSPLLVQLVSMPNPSLFHCSGQEPALSMLAADAACRWRRGERERGRGESHAHSAGTLLQLWAKGLHGKICHWQHRWSVKGEYKLFGRQIVTVKEEEKVNNTNISILFIELK